MAPLYLIGWWFDSLFLLAEHDLDVQRTNGRRACTPHDAPKTSPHKTAETRPRENVPGKFGSTRGDGRGGEQQRWQRMGWDGEGDACENGRPVVKTISLTRRRLKQYANPPPQGRFHQRIQNQVFGGWYFTAPPLLMCIG